MNNFGELVQGGGGMKCLELLYLKYVCQLQCYGTTAQWGGGAGKCFLGLGGGGMKMFYEFEGGPQRFSAHLRGCEIFYHHRHGTFQTPRGLPQV